MNSRKSTNAELSERASGLAHELSRIVMQEHKLLQAELRQITELTYDAVQELSRVTIELKTSTNDILSSQIDIDQRTVQILRDDLRSIGEKINKSTSETVRALQFGDILKQLTDHVLKRAVGMDALFTSLSNEVDMIKGHQKKSDEPDGLADRVSEHINTMYEKVESYKSSLPSTSPVKQKNLKMGKTELF